MNVLFPILVLSTLTFCMLSGSTLILTMWLLIRPFSLPFFLAFAAYFQDQCIRIIVFLSEHVFKNELVLYGDPVAKGTTSIILPNHLTQDWVPLYSLTIRIGMLGHIRGVVKKIIRWAPGFGWGMYLFHWLFLSRSWDQDRTYLNTFFSTLEKANFPIHLWLFVEGTRMSPKKLKESQDVAREKNYKVLQHCLIPRYRGFIATIHALRQSGDAVYDITLAYEGYGSKAPSIIQLMSPGSTTRRMHVHVRKVLIKDLPTDDAALKQWLLDSFARKDAILDQFYATGTMPGNRHPIKKIPKREYCMAFTWWTLAFFASAWMIAKLCIITSIV